MKNVKVRNYYLEVDCLNYNGEIRMRKVFTPILKVYFDRNYYCTVKDFEVFKKKLKVFFNSYKGKRVDGAILNKFDTCYQHIFNMFLEDKKVFEDIRDIGKEDKCIVLSKEEYFCYY